MSELRQAAQDAHSRIADYYLNAFGELATSLEALQATPNLADQDDGYALRHLPASPALRRPPGRPPCRGHLPRPWVPPWQYLGRCP